MNKWKKAAVAAAALVAVGGMAAGTVAVIYPRALDLFVHDDVRELRPDVGHDRREPSKRSALLVLAIDGVDRRLLYEMLRSGDLPHMAALLGGGGARFPHACFAEDVLTVLPSTTIPAWTTAFTGVEPGVHGITGNELFVREETVMVAPAPVSIDDLAPTLAVYTDDTLGRRLDVPTVYELLRQTDPPVRIWVAMSQIYRGADLLILAKRSVLAGAFGAFLRDSLPGATARGVYAELDEEVFDSVTDELEDRTPPDVLTVYIVGTDLYAHHAEHGPDVARRGYLREVLDPALAKLRGALDRRGFLADAHVVVLSDHGHTDVVHDERHALSTEGVDEPPELLRRAGFRVRPFEWKLDGAADFQAVLAYNGAMAFVYAADRSTCPSPGQACDWSRPPRWREDVQPIADAFVRANATGELLPALRGTIDMVLVRQEGPEPFGVYTDTGDVVSVDAYLAAHPHPTYVALASRLRALGSGPHAGRAGDVVLIAQNGNVDAAHERHYFAAQYRSWHGSPSRLDSEVPLIVAHAHRSTADLCASMKIELGADPTIARVTPLFLRLREPRPH